jgi:hypothetical protein
MATPQALTEPVNSGRDRNVIAHDINNHLNTIGLAISLLEQSNDPEVRHIVAQMTHGFSELKSLMREMRTHE